VIASSTVFAAGSCGAGCRPGGSASGWARSGTVVSWMWSGSAYRSRSALTSSPASVRETGSSSPLSTNSGGCGARAAMSSARATKSSRSAVRAGFRVPGVLPPGGAPHEPQGRADTHGRVNQRSGGDRNLGLDQDLQDDHPPEGTAEHSKWCGVYRQLLVQCSQRGRELFQPPARRREPGRPSRGSCGQVHRRHPCCSRSSVRHTAGMPRCIR
jgi:hypothetical protein